MPSRRSQTRLLRMLFQHLSRPGTPGFWVALLIVGIFVWQVYRAQQEQERELPPPPQQEAPAETGTSHFVKRVVDGDTLVMGDETRIRLIGVDTPETKKPNTPIQPFGPEASAFTKEHVEGKTVRLEWDHRKTDRYGRKLAYVYVGDWFLNEELIRAGLATAELNYSFSKAMKERFEAAEEEAKAARRGIWSLK